MRDEATTQLPDIVQDVDVPHDGENVHIPPAWIDDLPPNFDAFGFAVFLLSHKRGEVVTGQRIADRWKADMEQPLPATIRDMVDAGYLVPETADGVQRYRLVHPARLGPLPTA